MTLREKYMKLTDEQKEKLKDVKDEAGLDSFLSEMNATLSDEERQAVIEYLKTGSLPLTIDVLEDVAGGRWVHAPREDNNPKIVCGPEANQSQKIVQAQKIVQ